MQDNTPCSGSSCAKSTLVVVGSGIGAPSPTRASKWNSTVSRITCRIWSSVAAVETTPGTSGKKPLRLLAPTSKTARNFFFIATAFCAVPKGTRIHFFQFSQGLRPGLILFCPPGSPRTENYHDSQHLLLKRECNRVPSTPAANRGPPPLRMTVKGNCTNPQPLPFSLRSLLLPCRVPLRLPDVPSLSR